MSWAPTIPALVPAGKAGHELPRYLLCDLGEDVSLL